METGEKSAIVMSTSKHIRHFRRAVRSPRGPSEVAEVQVVIRVDNGNARKPLNGRGVDDGVYVPIVYECAS